MKQYVRFTLRTLLVIVCLLALALAYFANHARLERRAIRCVAEANGRILYRRHDLERNEVAVAGIQGELYDQIPPGSEFMHRLFGTTFTCKATQVYLPGNVDEETLRTICRMPKLQRIDLVDAKVDPSVVTALEAEYPAIDFAVPNGTR